MSEQEEECQEVSDDEENDDVFPPSLGAIHRTDMEEDDDGTDNDSMMASSNAEAYERRIRELEQTNAILRQNVAALYAENASNSIQPRDRRDSRSSINRITHMELSQDEAYVASIPHGDQLLLAEDHYLHTISTLEKNNAKLQSKLDRQKMLVAQLSANLKLATEQIQRLTQSKLDEAHSNSCSPETFGVQDKESETRQCQYVAAGDESINEIHQYQIQVIQNEIQSILHLISRNLAEHNKNTARLLDEYPNAEIISARNTGTTAGLDRMTFAERLQKVIGQLRGESFLSAADQNLSQQNGHTLHLEPDPLSTGGSENHVANRTNERMSEETTTYSRTQEGINNALFPSFRRASLSVMDELRSTETVGRSSSHHSDDSLHIIKEIDHRNLEESAVTTSIDKAVLNGDMPRTHTDVSVVQPSTDDHDTGMQGHISNDQAPTIAKDEYSKANQGFILSNHDNSDRDWQNAGFDEIQCCESNKSVNEIISLVEEAESVNYSVSEDQLIGVDESNKAEHPVHNNILSKDDTSNTSDNSARLALLEGYAITSRTDDRDNSANGNQASDRPHIVSYDSSSSLEKEKFSSAATKLNTNEVLHKHSGFESKISLTTPPENKSDDRNHCSSEMYRPAMFGYTISDLIPSKSVSVEAGDSPMRQAPNTASIQTTTTGRKNSADSTSSNEVNLACVKKENPRKKVHGMTMNSMTGSTLQTWDDVMRRQRSAILRSTKMDTAHSSAVRLRRRQLFQQPKISLSAGHEESNCLDPSIIASAKDGFDFIPPLLPPALPAMKNEDAPTFKKGLKDGFYNYRSSTGNEYSGNWKDGKRHGFGIAKYRDGEVYCGQWKSGRRHGVGTLHLANTEVFDGTWDSNKKHGIGTYFWADGDVDVSWYEHDFRLESIRWSKDRQSSYRLDLQSSKKSEIPLHQATKIMRDWERRLKTFES